MGLGLLFPLLLILNLGMSPALAGLALIPTTVPMVMFSSVAGRWYDRAGGRPPLVIGFGILALSGVALYLGVSMHNSSRPAARAAHLRHRSCPGAHSSTIPSPRFRLAPKQSGEASGVSATAEQAGGAVGIALLYSLFHAVYVGRLHQLINSGPLKDLNTKQYEELRSALQAAEQTGLTSTITSTSSRPIPPSGLHGFRPRVFGRLSCRDGDFVDRSAGDRP